MQTVIQALREILGDPDFYVVNSQYSNYWNYGAMIEYFVGALILLIVISSVFRFINKLIK